MNHEFNLDPTAWLAPSGFTFDMHVQLYIGTFLFKEEEEEDEEDVKARQIQAKLDAKKRKMAELALMKSRKRRPDPNNPSKEEIDVAQVKRWQRNY